MDFFAIFVWWLLLLFIGLIGWPLAFSLFRFLPDRGFTFIRPVGLLVSGYVLWLGATFRLLQNNPGGIVAALAVTLVAGLIWHRRQVAAGQSESVLAWLRRQWRYALAVELLFALAFAGWVYYKAHNPNIETVGGEKWMEIAFVNGILRSPNFPPQDPWLSGFGISYYYFGYVLVSMLTQLTGLISTTAFNLYIPTLFAATLTGALGIGVNLVQLFNAERDTAAARLLNWPAAATGLLSALFVGVLGNLIGVFEVLHKRGLLPADFWLWLDIRDLKVPPVGPADTWIPDRFNWWWRGSRVLTDYNLSGHEQEVIDEFPFFSFLLGDVHPHVLALPFVLLVTALALNVLANPAGPLTGDEPAPANFVDKLRNFAQNSGRALRVATGGWPGLALAALAVGGLSFLNTWDFPIYLGVVGLALIVWLARQTNTWTDALLPGLAGTATLGAAGLLLYLPFHLTFQSQARGILPNLWNPTRLPQFFVFFGPFLVAVLVFLLVLSARRRGWKKQAGWTIPLAIFGPLLLMMAAVTGVLVSPAGREYVESLINNPEIQAVIGEASVGALIQESLRRRLFNPWTFLLLGGLLGWSMALLIGLSDKLSQNGSVTRRRVVESFVLILLLAGLALPLVVEFIFLRDNFGTRMNTVFKFYFQSWVLLGLAAAFAVYYGSALLRGAPRLAFQTVMLVLVAGGMVYPVLATFNKTNNFSGPATLNGIDWVARTYPNDFAAVQWLRQNAPRNAVLLEAPGAGYAAYQYTGRISALTGIPTLLGWGGHESQWRGNYDEPARREPDIDRLYNTLDLQQARDLLNKYGITYVVVGPLERERYPAPGLEKFNQILTPVFQQGDVTIFQR